MQPIHFFNPIFQNARVGAPVYVPIVFALAGLLANEKRSNRMDPLTGVANRHGQNKWIKGVIKKAKLKILSDEVAIINFDLNEFKKVNDTLGHDVGDLMLKHFARTLMGSSKLRKDLVVRTGGDEFWIMMTAKDAKEASEKLVNRIKERLTLSPLRIEINDQETRLPIKFSCGIVTLPSSQITGKRIAEALKAADASMYKHKKQKKSEIRDPGYLVCTL